MKGIKNGFKNKVVVFLAVSVGGMIGVIKASLNMLHS